ncbi:uncharacterized protein [Linepithema humile]|uniref:uncharacterized protein n=1 Tax=Linepithema humile TaxID=83485 RepID=UPI00351E5316
MVDTIERAIRPLFLVTFIIGFGILRHPLDRPRQHLSICYMLILWSVYAYAYHYVIVLLVPNIFTNDNIKLFILTSNWFTMMILIITTVRKSEKFRICIRKLGFVDHTLAELGIPKEYRRIRNSIKWAFVMWLTMICMTWTTASYWYTKLYSDIRVIVIPPIMDYYIYVFTWIDITFALILRQIGTRLDKINEHIEQMAKTEEYGLRCTWQKSLVVTRHYIRTNNHQRVLWTAM